MGIYREELERMIAELDDGEQDEEAAKEAGQLLVEMIRLEGRAARLLSSRRRPSKSNAASALAGLSLNEAAKRVLHDAGEPLHVQELGKRIKARGWTHPRAKNAPEARIYFQLAARLGRHPDFIRVSPNTFGLRAWETRVPGASAVRPRLPLFSSELEGPSARAVGDLTEQPFEDEDNAWRSS